MALPEGLAELNLQSSTQSSTKSNRSPEK
jgi:hypothetical protein